VTLIFIFINSAKRLYLNWDFKDTLYIEVINMMHLIDVTNSYRDLVQRQLAATNSQFVKVYSLGNTTVVYSETADKIEIVMENHKRPIRQDEVEFVIKRLIHEDRIYDITVDKSRKIISITCDR
jgi:hypothetical protein